MTAPTTIFPRLNKSIKCIILLLIIGFDIGQAQEQPCKYIFAKCEYATADSIYVAIYNNTDSTVCVFTGFLDSQAAKVRWCDIDQMLYAHRYSEETDTYKVSFVPLTPFMQTNSHLPIVHKGYPGEPGMPFTYEFRTIGPMDKMIYPISKKSLRSKDYIYEYYPKKYPFYGSIATSKKGIKLYSRQNWKGDFVYLEKAPDRTSDWVQIEFAVFTEYDLITKQDTTITSSFRRWIGFIDSPTECNRQLRNYLFVTIPYNVE